MTSAGIPGDAELREIRRINLETRQLLAEVAANQEVLAQCLDRLDSVIVAKRLERRHG